MKEIPLTQGYVAIVDDEDYDKLAKFSWYRQGRYAGGHLGGGPGRLMHRVILGLSQRRRGDPEVDHINGDGLDNRKINLRVVSSRENRLNSRPRKRDFPCYRGVGWCKARGAWRARITVDGREVRLGYFNTPEAAARAYDNAAIKYNGAFAKPNFPQVRSVDRA